MDARIINDLQSAVIDGKTDLSTALRKAKVLALHLKNDEFKEWVGNELSGYPSDATLPEYRVLRVQSLGHFSGSFGRQINNCPIPTATLPGKLKDFAEVSKFGGSVKGIQSMARSSENGVLWETWPSEAVMLIGQHLPVEPDLNLIGARKRIAQAAVEGILDAVRNRLLDFLIGLKEVDPQILSSEEALRSVSEERVRNIFQYTIQGDRNVVAGGEGILQDVDQSITKGNQTALREKLQSLGLEESDLRALGEAINEDKSASEGGFGTKVQAWFGKVIAKASQGMLNVGATEASQQVTNALMKYYGLM